jgi:DNA polymerase III subunit delta'
MRMAAGGSGHFGWATPVSDGTRRADMAALQQWQRSLQRAARHDEHPWQEPLLLEALVDEGRRALGER